MACGGCSKGLGPQIVPRALPAPPTIRSAVVVSNRISVPKTYQSKITYKAIELDKHRLQ